MDHDVKSLMGQYGFDLIADTLPHDGDWSMIYVPSGTAVGDFTMSTGDSLTGITLASGWDYALRGPCTSLTLTSGTVYAYRAK